MLGQYNKTNYLTYNKSVTPINFLVFKGTYLSPNVWSSCNKKNYNTSLELLPKTFFYYQRPKTRVLYRVWLFYRRLSLATLS